MAAVISSENPRFFIFMPPFDRERARCDFHGKCLGILAAILCLASLTAGAVDVPLARDSGEPAIGRLTFGVYAHIRSTEMFKNMAPLRRYLQASMADKGVPVAVELKIFSSYVEAIDALSSAQVDFVRFGPVSYVLAKRKNPAIRLLAMESNGGKTRFNGVISVPADAPIVSVEDLRGKRFAFGNRRSTTGRYLAQAALVRAGIYGRDLADYAYLGRHDKVAFALAADSYDAGALNENTYRKYAESKGLRALLEFPCVTKPWIAREGLDEATFVALRAALLELKDAEVLQAIKRSGLLPASDADYDLIREGMALAEQFEDDSLSFAIYTSERPSVVYNTARPVLDRLEQALAAEGSTDRILIKVFRSYRDGIDALVRGDVDFGRFGPASYALAADQNSKLRVLVREDKEGGTPNGVFIVAAGSPIATVNQLKGKTFAFGNRHSTSGRYLAQAELVKAGLDSADLKGYSYLGRHDRVAYVVAAGNYDAGALRESVLRKYDIAKQVRVIHSFPVPHKVWIAREDMEDELFDALRVGLLRERDRRALDILGISGFKPFDEREYDSVRTGIRISEQFVPRQ